VFIAVTAVGVEIHYSAVAPGSYHEWTAMGHRGRDGLWCPHVPSADFAETAALIVQENGRRYWG
jgi:hypothetical protein